MKRMKAQSTKAVSKKAKKQSQPKPKKPAAEKVEDVRKLVHLLQVNQIELEHQNQELRLMEEELEGSRNKYVNLFDFSPIPYFVLDLGGAIREVNLCASKMLGVDRNKLIGRQFGAYIPQDEKNMFHAFMKTVFDSPVKRSCRLKVVGKDKLVTHVQLEGLQVNNILESDRKCQMALIDLTEYKEAEG